MQRGRSATAAAVAALGLALGLALTACSAPAEPAASGSAEATQPSSCDPEAIAAAIADTYAATSAAEGTGLALQEVSGVQCAQGWAIAMVRIGDGLGHDFQDREVLRRTAGAWQVADRMLVCGTVSPRRPAAVPPDAQVPDPLYVLACQTD